MGSADVQPDPKVWPECSECGVAWVLRRAMQFPKGYIWVWQRDCKHRKAKPRLNTEARTESI